MDLHPIEPGNLHVQGRLAKALHEIIDVRLLHHHRGLLVHDRRHAGGGPERVPLVNDHRALIVHARREELNKLFCAICVYRLGQLGVLGNDTLVPRRTAKKERAFAHGVSSLLLGNDERSATHGALAVKGNVAIAEDVVVRIIESFSGHHDAVLDRGAADGERSPDVGQGGGCCWH